jgi:hypothetical protein
MAFFLLLCSTTASIRKKIILTLVFDRNANYFIHNWQKSQNIAIITSTPPPSRMAMFFADAYKNRTLSLYVGI